MIMLNRLKVCLLCVDFQSEQSWAASAVCGQQHYRGHHVSSLRQLRHPTQQFTVPLHQSRCAVLHSDWHDVDLTGIYMCCVCYQVVTGRGLVRSDSLLSTSWSLWTWRWSSAEPWWWRTHECLSKQRIPCLVWMWLNCFVQHTLGIKIYVSNVFNSGLRFPVSSLCCLCESLMIKCVVSWHCSAAFHFLKVARQPRLECHKLHPR